MKSKTFKIKKGNHKSTWLPSLTCKSTIKGTVTFIGNHKYTIPKQYDTNKIIGLSDNYSHHKDSIRIGWRWSTKNSIIEILTISYRNGKRTITPLTVATTNQPYSFSIAITPTHYNVNWNNTTTHIPKTSKWNGPRYKLFPYFGGTTKAPLTLQIQIKWTH